MTATPLDLDELRAWVGRTHTETDVVSATPAQALAATLGIARTFAPGDALPPPWHWQYFLTMGPLDDTGPDGHPKRGGFLPPVPLPRRMWAGSRMTFAAPLRIGDAISRASTIADVTAKEGRTGTLVFVKVRHAITGPAGHALTDEHDIVYRDQPRAGETPPPSRAAPVTGAWRREVRPDPVLLFRYSALTYNSHRIHYDHPYVTGVEGYPGLVVHGPLTSTLLIDFARDHNPGRTFLTYTTQARAPLFDTAPFELRGRPSAKGCELWAVTPEGTIAMSAEVDLQ